jgi:RNA polymerase sigma-70 factor (ECF subfamily)
VGATKAASFAGLYTAYARDVYRFALYLSGDAALAQDITSEVFLRVWTSTEPVRVSTVKSWLFVIARNLYLHELRRIRRRESLDDRTASEQSLETDTAMKHEFARVSRAMAQLPEVDRSALLLRAVEELPYEEIAAVLRISIASAKVKVHRARLRLGEICHEHLKGNHS